MLGALLAFAITSVARLLTGTRSLWIGCAPLNRQRIYFANHSSHGDCRAVGNLSDCAIIHTFAAMITSVDETVFNVTTTLKEYGLWENTLLVWTTGEY